MGCGSGLLSESSFREPVYVAAVLFRSGGGEREGAGIGEPVAWTDVCNDTKALDGPVVGEGFEGEAGHRKGQKIFNIHYTAQISVCSHIYLCPAVFQCELTAAWSLVEGGP